MTRAAAMSRPKTTAALQPSTRRDSGLRMVCLTAARYSSAAMAASASTSRSLTCSTPAVVTVSVHTMDTRYASLCRYIS